LVYLMQLPTLKIYPLHAPQKPQDGRKP